MRDRVRSIAALVAIVLVFGVAFVTPGAAQRASLSAAVPRPVTPRGDLGPDEKATIELFQNAHRSVVYVSTSERVADLWTRIAFSIPRGTGSGFVCHDEGHVVTNYHVVSGAAGARVRLDDARDVSASLVGANPVHDLATPHIDVPKEAVPVHIGTSHDLRVGQKVFAIGNPFGLDWTLTTGIISALDRSLPSENGRSVIEHLIQTDAAINPGNSGGPLLDSAGRLIGVNVAMFSPSGASAGVGFAIPVETVNGVIPQLIANGRYVQPTIGIETDDSLNRLVTSRLGLDGIPGDLIVESDGRKVQRVAQFYMRLDDHHIGDSVRLGVMRNDRGVMFQ